MAWRKNKKAVEEVTPEAETTPENNEAVFGDLWNQDPDERVDDDAPAETADDEEEFQLPEDGSIQIAYDADGNGYYISYDPETEQYFDPYSGDVYDISSLYDAEGNPFKFFATEEIPEEPGSETATPEPLYEETENSNNDVVEAQPLPVEPEPENKDTATPETVVANETPAVQEPEVALPEEPVAVASDLPYEEPAVGALEASQFSEELAPDQSQQQLSTIKEDEALNPVTTLPENQALDLATVVPAQEEQIVPEPSYVEPTTVDNVVSNHQFIPEPSYVVIPEPSYVEPAAANAATSNQFSIQEPQQLISEQQSSIYPESQVSQAPVVSNFEYSNSVLNQPQEFSINSPVFNSELNKNIASEAAMLPASNFAEQVAINPTPTNNFNLPIQNKEAEFNQISNNFVANADPAQPSYSQDYPKSFTPSISDSNELSNQVVPEVLIQSETNQEVAQPIAESYSFQSQDLPYNVGVNQVSQQQQQPLAFNQEFANFNSYPVPAVENNNAVSSPIVNSHIAIPLPNFNTQNQVISPTIEIKEEPVQTFVQAVEQSIPEPLPIFESTASASTPEFSVVEEVRQPAFTVIEEEKVPALSVVEDIITSNIFAAKTNKTLANEEPDVDVSVREEPTTEILLDSVAESTEPIVETDNQTEITKTDEKSNPVTVLDSISDTESVIDEVDRPKVSTDFNIPNETIEEIISHREPITEEKSIAKVDDGQQEEVTKTYEAPLPINAVLNPPLALEDESDQGKTDAPIHYIAYETPKVKTAFWSNYVGNEKYGHLDESGKWVWDGYFYDNGEFVSNKEELQQDMAQEALRTDQQEVLTEDIDNQPEANDALELELISDEDDNEEIIPIPISAPSESAKTYTNSEYDDEIKILSDDEVDQEFKDSDAANETIKHVSTVEFDSSLSNKQVEEKEVPVVTKEVVAEVIKPQPKPEAEILVEEIEPQVGASLFEKTSWSPTPEQPATVVKEVTVDQMVSPVMPVLEEAPAPVLEEVSFKSNNLASFEEPTSDLEQLTSEIVSGDQTEISEDALFKTEKYDEEIKKSFSSALEFLLKSKQEATTIYKKIAKELRIEIDSLVKNIEKLKAEFKDNDGRIRSQKSEIMRSLSNDFNPGNNYTSGRDFDNLQHLQDYNKHLSQTIKDSQSRLVVLTSNQKQLKVVYENRIIKINSDITKLQNVMNNNGNYANLNLFNANQSFINDNNDYQNRVNAFLPTPMTDYLKRSNSSLIPLDNTVGIYSNGDPLFDDNNDISNILNEYQHRPLLSPTGLIHTKGPFNFSDSIFDKKPYDLENNFLDPLAPISEPSFGEYKSNYFDDDFETLVPDRTSSLDDLLGGDTRFITGTDELFVDNYDTKVSFSDDLENILSK